MSAARGLMGCRAHYGRKYRAIVSMTVRLFSRRCRLISVKIGRQPLDDGADLISRAAEPRSARKTCRPPGLPDSPSKYLSM